jgi:hypothetical protein
MARKVHLKSHLYTVYNSYLVLKENQLPVVNHAGLVFTVWFSDTTVGW